MAAASEDTPPVDVTVVIPTYNRPDLLRETVDSVLAQTRPAREIIVVDNGSNNETQLMLREVYGDRVSSIKINPVGQQAARNAGFAAATSTWLATLDDDDLYRPTFLEAVGQIIDDGRANMISSDHRKFQHPHGNGVVAPNTNAENAPDGYWSGIPRPEDGQDWSYVGTFPVERLIRFNGFYTSTLVMRRDLIDQLGGYDPRVRGIKCEDLEMLSRALPIARLAFIWKDLVEYRRHDSNTTIGPFAIRYGRWRIFEFVYRQNVHGSPAYAAALEEALPKLRVRVFDLAFRQKQFDVMAEAADKFRPEDWTVIRKFQARVAKLPRPLAGSVVRAVAPLQRGGRAYDTNAMRRWQLMPTKN